MYHFPLAPAMPHSHENQLACTLPATAAHRGRRRTPERQTCAGHGGKSVKPAYWDEATRALAERDRVMKRLIRAYPGHSPATARRPFTTLSRAIVGQQISVKAAERSGTASRDVAPRREAVAFATRSLRRRARGVDGAAHLRPVRAQGRVPARPRARISVGRARSGRWKELDDEALIAALVEVKGIGRWTAEMFLIFHELRADVLPVDDIGLQRAIALHYSGGERITPAAMREIARALAAVPERRDVVPVALARSDSGRVLTRVRSACRGHVDECRYARTRTRA